MDQASAQTEKITTYETSRTRRSIVDGKIHGDDSNNDEEYATSGFYVREKPSAKKTESDKITSKKGDEDFKENGVSPRLSSPPSPVVNGEDSKDEESSRDSKKENLNKNEDLDKQSKEDQSDSKEDTEPEKKDPSGSKEDMDPEKKDQSGAKEDTEPEKKDQSGSKEDIEPEKKDHSCAKEATEPEKKDQSGAKEDTEPEKKDQSGFKENIDSENDETPNSKLEKKGQSDSQINIELEKEETSKSPKEQDGKKQESKAESEDAEHNKKGNVDDTANSDKSEERDCSEKNKLEKNNDEEKEPNPVEKDVKEGEGNKEEVTNDEIKNTDDSNIESDSNKKKENEAGAEKNKDEEKSKDVAKEESKEKSIEDNKTEKDDKSNEVKIKTDSEKETSEGSILKEQLEREKPAHENSEENAETEMEMDEDFDPSLLCPDISMDVDEARVITNTEPVPEDGNTSPLPYEATFSTLVDEITGAEVQVDLTPEEMELRQKMYGPNNLVQTTKVHCTACNVHLGSALTGANNRFVHPLLKVLICKNCYHFYTSGEFEKDEDGSELYCRWCGQGGQVLCCSSCEFVFCKRCIRNNFGPRKFKEIRDSDDWSCFRCDRGQLSNLRASCAEFMEYYRTELARAQALSSTNPDLMTTDYTTCCKSGNEKKEEPKTPAQPKNSRRKRKEEVDPDYRPVVEGDEEPPTKKFGTSTPTGGPGYTVIPPSVRPSTPKPTVSQAVRPVVPQPAQKQNQGQMFKVGNTTFRAKAASNGQGYTVQRPTLNQGQKSNSPGYITIPPSAAPKTTSPGYITIPPTAVPKTTTPGYIKILPQRMPAPRPSTYTVVSGTNNGKPTFTTVRAKQAPPTPPTMKHEWFEKTVRAAARVNSNLSYTLTQLNRQQSQANSVEALAMVHNKLQEVLSTSINSLIQIRKNLRTEFISGIKNIKFPAKTAPITPTSGPIIVKDDDDVIFVSSPPKSMSPLPPPPPLVLSPSVTLTKKTPIQNTSDPFADPKPSTSGFSPKPNNTPSTNSTSTPTKGGFLKVRSFTSLQSVPSECITIPDDPPTGPDVKIIEEEDPLMITDEDKPKENDEESPSPAKSEIIPPLVETLVYNVKDKPTPAIKKMLSARVVVKKSRVVDDIIRAQGLLKEKENETKVDESESEKELMNDKEEENESDKKRKGNESEKKENEKEKIEKDEINPEQTKMQSGGNEDKKETSDEKEDSEDGKKEDEMVKENSAKGDEKS